MPRTDGIFEIRWLGIFLLIVVLAGCASSDPASEVPGRNISDHSTGAVKEKGPWQEADVPLPPYPDEANLTEFQIAGRTSFKFYTDPASVRVDEDRVVRMAVVARSASGAENVTYEGIRCETREYKIYAFGSIDRTWLPRKNAQWIAIEKKNDNAYHFSLRRYYFCLSSSPPRDTRAAVEVLMHGELIIEDGHSR